MGLTVHFQLGRLLFLLRAEIWVTSNLGKSSFLGITVWIVWGGEEVEWGEGTRNSRNSVAEKLQVCQKGGRKTAGFHDIVQS